MSPENKVYFLHIPKDNALDLKFGSEWLQLSAGTPLHGGATGGTATIHRIKHPPQLATHALKLYSQERLKDIRTPEHHNKLSIISRLATQSFHGLAPFAVSREHVSWPLFLVYEQKTAQPAHLAGFLMEYYSDAHSIEHLTRAHMRKKYFPNATRQHMGAVAESIADGLHKLHTEPPHFKAPSNIVFGDLSLNNVLIHKTTYQTYLLDSDSFQFTNAARTRMLPSGQSTPGCRARSIALAHLHKKSVPPFTQDTDNECLAILIFHLLVDGNHPWLIKGGTPLGELGPEDALAKGIFPYAPANHAYAPDYTLGLYKQLPREIQDAFLKAFTSSTPPTALTWRNLLAGHRRYL